jgi:nicotinamide phosphoribosyltransferase
MGHLLSFKGTDSIPASLDIKKYYPKTSSKEVIAMSVNATEHSVMSSYGKENEFESYKRLIEKYPSGILSVVSDT